MASGDGPFDQAVFPNLLSEAMAVKSTAAAVETQSRKVADSARKLKESSVRIEDSADRRTELASNRTALAAERTYSAWIRTGLLSLASGVGAKSALAGLIPAWVILLDINALMYSACSASALLSGGWIIPERQGQAPM